MVTDPHLPATPPTDTGPSGDAIADDIRQLITLRSRRSLRDRSFPALFALLPVEASDSTEARYHALVSLIDGAVAAIPDDAHRSAAAALMGSGEGRWRTVAQRGSDAASAFGCGWDAYRRKRANGSSQLDDTIDTMVHALQASPGAGRAERGGEPDAAGSPGRSEPPVRPSAGAWPTATPPGDAAPVLLGASDTRPDAGPSSPVDELPAPPDISGSRRARVLVAAGVAIAVVAGAVAVWALFGPGPSSRPVVTDSTVPAACSRLEHEPGDLPPGADEELRRWSPLFRKAAESLPEGTPTCAGLMEHAVGLVVQPLVDTTQQGIGSIVSSDVDEPRALILSHQEFWSYQKFVDAFGDAAGVPARRADRSPDLRVVELTNGAMVGGDHQKSWLVFGAVYLQWQARGGIDGEMGVPLTNLYDVIGTGKVQDFQFGRVVIEYTDASRLKWEPIPEPAAQLPADVTEMVLRSGDGTAWWVDSHSVRHWISTESAYYCAVGTGTETLEVEAQAIATLQIGTAFRCR